ncbi:MAG: ATP-binding protein [Anaerolineae bacterium]|nr:ATP-binding protein [Anaerolineae bacterium]
MQQSPFPNKRLLARINPTGNSTSMSWMLRYERLALWAREEWQRRQADQPYRLVWASESCGNQLAQSRIQPRRRLKSKAYYTDVEQVECDQVIPISEHVTPGRDTVLGETVGAFVFHFEHPDGPFEVLYVSSYYRDDDPNIVAIALVPDNRLAPWAKLESLFNDAVRRPSRRQDVYIIGGTNAYFKPTVDWDAVILPARIKQDLRSDMEAFFKEGVPIYQELNLAPFRKLLLVGPPGTGKTMLCAAMAKLALRKKRVVVYVSGADDDGASFHKIHHALNVVANAGYPVLLIVEEIDVYLRKDDKARILNVLDGLESPNNPRGALLLATTNYPEVIDERIAKRPGRMDRIIVIPPIKDEALATEMLQHYMGPQWQPDHAEVVSQLVGQTGAFVREIALHARMLAAHKQQRVVTLETLRQSIGSLTHQINTGDDLMPRRQIGFGAEPGGNGFGDLDDVEIEEDRTRWAEPEAGED